MILGILGLVLLSVSFGIVALRQIRRTGDKGRGLAIAGFIASTVWVVVLAVLVAIGISAIRHEINASGERRSPAPPSLRLLPQPGECFNFPSADSSATIPTVSCRLPHDGQAILTITLPDGPWPGTVEVEQQAHAGCDEQIRATYKLHTGPADTQLYVMVPRRPDWLAGNRTVTCALTAADGGRLTGIIVMRDTGVREWTELAAGDCFTDSSYGTTTVFLESCDSEHKAQVTHTFELPGGAWPGETAVATAAQRGCTARQRAYFGSHPSPVRLDHWHIDPTPTLWAMGDRQVTCYVTAQNQRPLKGSVMTQ